MNTDLAWQVIAVAAAVGAVALWATFWWLLPARTRFGGIWRWSLVALVLVFFVMPAPVPNYAGVSAPAFVVMLFEALFQTSGEPEESMRRLIVGGAIITAMALVAAIVGRLMRGR